jgi:putative transposase
MDEKIPIKKSRFAKAQIMSMLRHAEAGLPVVESCREHRTSGAAFCKRRIRNGGMEASLMSQMKALKQENQRLKCMFADLSMQAYLLRVALGKK